VVFLCNTTASWTLKNKRGIVRADMHTFFYFTLVMASIAILAIIVFIRKRIEVRQWWNELCDDAECSSITAQLYQALEDHERQLLLEHLHANTISNLRGHASPTLAALAHDLHDYVNPQARIRAVQQAIERQQQRRQVQSQEKLAH
jgi:hypothetical protein